jgi:carbamoyl-phosphate synthase large subunit
MRRVLARSGWTDKAEVVDPAEFLPAMLDLCERFRPVGPTNFQFRLCADGPKLLEINPRISASTSIRTAFGYNESAMAVEWFGDRRAPTRPKIRQGRAVRYTDEIVFYEDAEGAGKSSNKEG